MAGFIKKKNDYIKIPSNLFEMEEIQSMNNEIIISYLRLVASCNYKYKNDVAIKIYTTQDVDKYDYLLKVYGIRKYIIEYLESENLVLFKYGYLIVCNIWKKFNIRNSPAYVLWRNSVFERDDYACKLCKTNKKLQAHHIVRWVDSIDLRFELSNGITLCESCHRKIHNHSRGKQ